MADIIRNPTEDELKDFTPIETPQGRVLSPKDKFLKIAAERALAAQLKGLPFAKQVALIEWEDYYKGEVDKQKKKFGYVKEEIAVIPINWEKYCDLKNFDLLEEKEVYDDHLSKRYSKQIYLKMKTYQYKGYYYKYQVMEDGILALNRLGVK